MDLVKKIKEFWGIYVCTIIWENRSNIHTCRFWHRKHTPLFLTITQSHHCLVTFLYHTCLFQHVQLYRLSKLTIFVSHPICLDCPLNTPVSLSDLFLHTGEMFSSYIPISPILSHPGFGDLTPFSPQKTRPLLYPHLFVLPLNSLIELTNAQQQQQQEQQQQHPTTRPGGCTPR